MKVTRTDLHRCYSPISFTVIRNTLGSCGYVYLAVYPTPETKK
nr:type IV toxin-antitoxin system YeeU family antitoxin [Escherichia coli]